MQTFFATIILFLSSCGVFNKYKLIENFDISNNEIALVGSEYTEKPPIGQYISYTDEGSALSFFKTYDFDLNTSNSMIDIGVIDFNYQNINSNPDSCANMTGGWNYFYNHEFINATATIENFGTQTVNQLTVYFRSKFDCVHFCPLHEIQQWTFNVNLQPGQTTTVNLQDFIVDDSNPIDIKLWTGAPNNKMDNNHSNDSYFEQVGIVNTTQKIVNQLSLFPSPAQDIININLNTPENMNFQVINTAGQIILENSQIISLNKTINISNLSAGFYVIKGISESGQSYIGKFIKK